MERGDEPMESRRPRTERSALVLTDLPHDSEALTDPEALAAKGGERYCYLWIITGDGYDSQDMELDAARTILGAVSGGG
jgi:hypothetical protein